jgi:hypothetical protein
MPKPIVLLLLAIAGFSIGGLVFGASYSEWMLPGGLPFGNLLAATGLCSLAGLAFSLAPPASMRRRVSRLALFAAILWLPLSIVLAGNLALNFSGVRGTIWFALSSATAITAFGALLCAVVGLLFGSRGKTSAD